MRGGAWDVLLGPQPQRNFRLDGIDHFIVCLPLVLRQVSEKKEDRTLQAYTNLEVAVGHMRQPRFETRTLQSPEAFACKLYHVAKYVLEESSQKTVILIRKSTGSLVVFQ